MKPALIDVLASLYPDSTPAIDWNVQRVDDVPTIVSWNDEKLGPRPTPEAIASKAEEMTRANLKRRIAARRAEAEESGSVTIGKIAFGTSSSARLGVLEAVAFSLPGDTIRFKDAAGVIRKLSREELVSLGGKLLQHLEEVRATQEQLDAELLASGNSELSDFGAKVEKFAIDKNPSKT